MTPAVSLHFISTMVDIIQTLCILILCGIAFRISKTNKILSNMNADLDKRVRELENKQE